MNNCTIHKQKIITYLHSIIILPYKTNQSNHFTQFSPLDIMLFNQLFLQSLLPILHNNSKIQVRLDYVVIHPTGYDLYYANFRLNNEKNISFASKRFA